jgi:hypothetical protein
MFPPPNKSLITTRSITLQKIRLISIQQTLMKNQTLMMITAALAHPAKIRKHAKTFAQPLLLFELAKSAHLAKLVRSISDAVSNVQGQRGF